MKKLLLYVILVQMSLQLYAIDIEKLTDEAQKGDASSAITLAQFYESSNDKDKAFIWYKKAALLSSMPHSSSALQEELNRNQTAKASRTKEVYADILASYSDKETRSSVEQMLTKSFDIAPYHINYLLPFTYNASAGNDRRKSETKFQVSFQKTLADNVFGLNETFIAGYTQTSWWQTAAESAPFRETNYQPEIFVVMPHFDKESALKAYQFGLLHESNGQGGDLSRSWNRLYAKAFFQYNGLVIAPRVWYRLPENKETDDNPNIDDYLGYGDISFIYPWKEHSFTLLVRNNFRFSDANKGAVQFDWTFPLWENNLFGYLQFYSGYSESLIDYDKRSNRVAVGFALSR
ncbi:MAG: phospholipase A [Sulfurospirillaceae bacterium]|nr:phospholipase A [Sulfurospirillaceae bacterium]